MTHVLHVSGASERHPENMMHRDKYCRWWGYILQILSEMRKDRLFNNTARGGHWNHPDQYCGIFLLLPNGLVIMVLKKAKELFLYKLDLVKLITKVSGSVVDGFFLVLYTPFKSYL
jgi:hypothetical protein